MGEVATLLTAIAGLITAMAGAFGVVITALRSSRKERISAAKEGEATLAADLAKAGEDGEITADELLDIVKKHSGEDSS